MALPMKGDPTPEVSVDLLFIEPDASGTECVEAWFYQGVIPIHYEGLTVSKDYEPLKTHVKRPNVGRGNGVAQFVALYPPPSSNSSGLWLKIVYGGHYYSGPAVRRAANLAIQQLRAAGGLDHHIRTNNGIITCREKIQEITSKIPEARDRYVKKYPFHIGYL